MFGRRCRTARPPRWCRSRPGSPVGRAANAAAASAGARAAARTSASLRMVVPPCGSAPAASDDPTAAGLALHRTPTRQNTNTCGYWLYNHRNGRGGAPASVRRRRARGSFSRAAGAVTSASPPSRSTSRRSRRSSACSLSWAAGRGVDPDGGGAARRLCPARRGSARERASGARGGDDAEIGTLSLAASGIPGHVPAPGRSAGSEAHPGVESTSSSRRPRRARARPRPRLELALVGGFDARPSWRASRSSTTRSCSSARPRSAAAACGPELEGLTWISREEGSATRAARRGRALGDRAARGAGRSSCPPGRRSSGRSRAARHRRDQPSRDRPRARAGRSPCSTSRAGACGERSRSSRPATCR